MRESANQLSKEQLKFVYLELTVRCNLACEFCDKKMRNSYKDISSSQFKSIVDQLLPETKLCLHGIGEPTMHKDLVDFIYYAKCKNHYVYFNTNFSLVTETQMKEFVSARLDELRISLSAGRKEEYYRYSGQNIFDRVLTNINKMIQIRGASTLPLLRVVFVLTPYNVEEVNKVAEICDKLGVDELMIQNMQNWGQVNGARLEKLKNGIFTSIEQDAKIKNTLLSIPQKTKHTRVIIPENFKSNVELQKKDKQCQWPFNAIWITANGYITPCCNIHNPKEITLGNVFNKNIYECWLNDKYNEFRKNYLSNNINPCTTCPIHYDNFKTYKYK